MYLLNLIHLDQILKLVSLNYNYINQIIALTFQNNDLPMNPMLNQFQVNLSNSINSNFLQRKRNLEESNNFIENDENLIKQQLSLLIKKRGQSLEINQENMQNNFDLELNQNATDNDLISNNDLNISYLQNCKNKIENENISKCTKNSNIKNFIYKVLYIRIFRTFRYVFIFYFIFTIL